MSASPQGQVERLDPSSLDTLQVVLHRQRYDFALSHIVPEDWLLEVGTGTGFFSQQVVGRCKEFVGLEYDPEACETTRNRLGGRGKVVQGDAQALPFPDHSFSVIVCLEVLEHLNDYRKAVSEIQRCLKPRGRVIVSVPHRTRGGTNPHNRFHIYEPGEAELASAFRAHFGEVQVLYQYFEETRLMTFARVLHLRSAMGLRSLYRDLELGAPSATAKLRIAERARGLKICLLLVATGLRADQAKRP